MALKTPAVFVRFVHPQISLGVEPNALENVLVHIDVVRPGGQAATPRNFVSKEGFVPPPTARQQRPFHRAKRGEKGQGEVVHPQPVHEGDARALAVGVEAGLEREDVRLVLGNTPQQRHPRVVGVGVGGGVGVDVGIGVGSGRGVANRRLAKVRTAGLHFAGHRRFVLQQVVADVAHALVHEPHILQDGGRQAVVFGFVVLPEREEESTVRDTPAERKNRKQESRQTPQKYTMQRERERKMVRLVVYFCPMYLVLLVCLFDMHTKSRCHGVRADTYLPEVRAGFSQHVLHAVPLEGQRDLFDLGQGEGEGEGMRVRVRV
jgi:hypothetical protein